jgi:hypothetical protein
MILASLLIFHAHFTSETAPMLFRTLASFISFEDEMEQKYPRFQRLLLPFSH